MSMKESLLSSVLRTIVTLLFWCMVLAVAYVMYLMYVELVFSFLKISPR